MPIRRPPIRLALLCGLALTAGAAGAGSIAVPHLGALIEVPVISFKEQRFYGVVQQRYDFSCGSAALATLLSHHHGQPTDEKSVFEAMYALGDPDKIRRQGFSLFDMKRYLASRGLKADGLRMTLEQLETARVPGIALTTVNGYRHFVVIKGLSEREVLVGDPALGLKAWPRQTFEAGWNGVLFVIHDGRDLLGERFDAADAWGLRAPPPLHLVAERPRLADFTPALPRNIEF